MGRKMSASEKRRLLRITRVDRQAKKEGDAIDKMRVIGPVQAKRIRLSHGEKHRSI